MKAVLKYNRDYLPCIILGYFAAILVDRHVVGTVHIVLTHWGRVTHICVVKITNIGSDNGLSPGRRQAIIWTNAGIWLIAPLETNFSETLIEIQTFSLKQICLKMSSAICLFLQPVRKIVFSSGSLESSLSPV